MKLVVYYAPVVWEFINNCDNVKSNLHLVWVCVCEGGGEIEISILLISAQL